MNSKNIKYLMPLWLVAIAAIFIGFLFSDNRVVLISSVVVFGVVFLLAFPLIIKLNKNFYGKNK
ncbi:hypothetical protein ACIPCE_07735 [Rothia terrae]|uniref:hypothetical protein n=1 Tax=Rothia terrae TaxID=396015 RepID=UPI003826D697